MKENCVALLGNYKQADLNLPKTVVTRESYKDFLRDSPLTEIGKFQARATGKFKFKFVLFSRRLLGLRRVADGRSTQVMVADLGQSSRCEDEVVEWQKRPEKKMLFKECQNILSLALLLNAIPVFD